MFTFMRWVPTPENQAARLAVAQVADAGFGQRAIQLHNPLFLHGPAGNGKTHLVSALAGEVAQRYPHCVIEIRSAADLTTLFCSDKDEQTEDFETDSRAGLMQCDLLVIEDLQHLLPRLARVVARVLDDRIARQRQTVLTSTAGPAHLANLPFHLTSRLAGGLVVGIAPLAPASRLTMLERLAKRKRITLSQEVLLWLAEHLNGSVRQLEGALTRLETVARLQSRPLAVSRVADLFQSEAAASRPTMERITQRVGRYFQVEPGQLQTKRRSRNNLLPRQVSMYLARHLTSLSLDQIGAYFGGRDHSTVLHACRKIEQALVKDANLSGAIRQLNADLG
jgi:chromosomal replication initiator protein